MQRLNVQITSDQFKKLRDQKVEGRSLAAHIREILDAHFKQQERSAKK